jgi:hypothetical protein
MIYFVGTLHVLSYQFNKVIDKRLRFIPHPEGAVALERFVKAYGEFKEAGNDDQLKLLLFETVCLARKNYWKTYAEKYTKLVDELIPQYDMALKHEGTDEIAAYRSLLTQFYAPGGRELEDAERQKIQDRIDAKNVVSPSLRACSTILKTILTSLVTARTSLSCCAFPNRS